jgi:hypothetical protein
MLSNYPDFAIHVLIALADSLLAPCSSIFDD